MLMVTAQGGTLPFQEGAASLHLCFGTAPDGQALAPGLPELGTHRGKSLPCPALPSPPQPRTGAGAADPVLGLDMDSHGLFLLLLPETTLPESFGSISAAFLSKAAGILEAGKTPQETERK